jgi:hypothetical protein
MTYFVICGHGGIKITSFCDVTLTRSNLTYRVTAQKTIKYDAVEETVWSYGMQSLCRTEPERYSKPLSAKLLCGVIYGRRACRVLWH